MLVRITYKKFGNMKFIGHLDLMRYFQKAFRRANFDLKYSQGYNPHIILSFASPLGVGITSDREYLDLALNSSLEANIMKDKLNDVLTEGFLITDFKILKEINDNKKVTAAMSLVSDADYLISLKDDYYIPNINTLEDFSKCFYNYLNQESILINKKNKKGQQLIDIKPFIKFIAFSYDDYIEKLIERLDTTTVDKDKLYSFDKSAADKYLNGIKFFIQLSSGSVNNINPNLVIEGFHNFINHTYNPYAYQIHRIDLYTNASIENKIISIGSL